MSSLSRRCFLGAGPIRLAAAVAALPVSAGSPAANGLPPLLGRSRRHPMAGDGVARVDLGARISARILQFTDVHFFRHAHRSKPSAADLQTVDDWRQCVRHYHPDLVMVTGDLWHNNPGGRGMAALEYALCELERLEVPWAFSWGNHDRLDDYQAGHDALEASPASVYRGGATHGDYRIELCGRSGRLRRSVFVLNSHRWGLAVWQMRWLAQEIGRGDGPALAFFHIPVLQQKELFQPGVTPGVRGEPVCNELEHGLAFQVLSRGQRIRACFCGHDHANDFQVATDGIGLVYGRATGYSGYGGEILRKGAKLIEFDMATGDWSAQTVFADGSRWTPA